MHKNLVLAILASVAQKAGVPVIGTSTTAVGSFIFRDSLPQAAVIPVPSIR